MATGAGARPNIRKAQKPRNAIRAERAAQVLQQYRVTGIHEHNVEAHTLISDLLTDIRHLCDRVGLDFAQHDREAHLTYIAERYPR